MNTDNNAEIRKRQFKKLMREIRRDPHKGMEAFYETYKGRIQATATRICGSTDKANEVVNDVLVKVWMFAQKNVTVDNPEGWIFIVTANTAKSALRGRVELSLEENIVASEDGFQKIYDKDAFDYLIKDLSETEQKILIARFEGAYKFQEIADELKLPLPTVTSLYYRSLKKLEKKFENHEEK